jgi:hypothetical protein
VSTIGRLPSDDHASVTMAGTYHAQAPGLQMKRSRARRWSIGWKHWNAQRGSHERHSGEPFPGVDRASGFIGPEGEPVFQEARPPITGELQSLLVKIITRIMTMLTRQGYLIEAQGMSYLADIDADNALEALASGLVHLPYCPCAARFESLVHVFQIVPLPHTAHPRRRDHEPALQ